MNICTVIHCMIDCLLDLYYFHQHITHQNQSKSYFHMTLKNCSYFLSYKSLYTKLPISYCYLHPMIPYFVLYSLYRIHYYLQIRKPLNDFEITGVVGEVGKYGLEYKVKCVQILCDPLKCSHKTNSYAHHNLLLLYQVDIRTIAGDIFPLDLWK